MPIKPQQFNCNYFPAYASFDKNKLSYSLFTSTGEQHLNIEPSSGILSGYFQCNEPTSLLTISVSYGIYTGSIILPINVSHSTSSSTIIQHEK
ncbi:hypothetical protein FACS189459_4190 [Bacilli bacterium]|nr:hypothetical protein FACS189459_4190 [Bacilli bacterium]